MVHKQEYGLSKQAAVHIDYDVQYLKSLSHTAYADNNATQL